MQEVKVDLGKEGVLWIEYVQKMKSGWHKLIKKQYWQFSLKTYDMQWKAGLLIKVHQMGIGDKGFNWIMDFLNKTTVQVKVRCEMWGINGDLSFQLKR